MYALKPIKLLAIILTPQSGNPCTDTHLVIFCSNYHFSAISWNIFIQFEVIVYETILTACIFIIMYS